MAQKPTHRVTFTPARLSVGQADGTACVVCKADYLAEAQGIPSVPVGTVNGAQVFACASHTEPAAEGKSNDWPAGEPATVRDAEASVCPAWCIEGPKRHHHHRGMPVLIARRDGDGLTLAEVLPFQVPGMLPRVVVDGPNDVAAVLTAGQARELLAVLEMTRGPGGDPFAEAVRLVLDAITA
ncbi:hypothetical protein [Actinomadura rugatobispora]|uniref:Uncharacterized protein n=1 Tax=Actinomadura rugatobispora TaxID=1994 RepID=A0ABW1A5I2_9ACTN|nr:hypothetical protein GCM10010200_028980 [Actinomadura rugatobispora]